MTGNSLTNRSLAQRISRKTICRPMVKLRPRNSAVPTRLWPSDHRSIAPCAASPNTTDMITQPVVSSMIAAATMTWPMVRRRKPTSRTTIATILTEEIDSATPRNKVVIKRLPGSGNIVSGSHSPSAKPQMNGKTMPQSEMLNAARRERRTTDRSVSIPVSNSSSNIPSCATASIIAFCSAFDGNKACWPAGQRAPRTEGPSRIPAINWPMTAGWPMRCIASPMSRPATRRATIWQTKMISEGPC